WALILIPRPTGEVGQGICSRVRTTGSYPCRLESPSLHEHRFQAARFSSNWKVSRKGPSDKASASTFPGSTRLHSMTSDKEHSKWGRALHECRRSNLFCTTKGRTREFHDVGRSPGRIDSEDGTT